MTICGENSKASGFSRSACSNTSFSVFIFKVLPFFTEIFERRFISTHENVEHKSFWRYAAGTYQSRPAKRNF